MLLYVGRLSPEKNIEMLLAAFEALHARHPNTYHLVIVGDGPLRRVLPATRHRTGALTWRSYIQDNAKLADYYHAADLFIHPGVCETFGLVVLEAQACGLPCVGVRGSFMDANIMVGLDHWATQNDPNDIADAIERYEHQDLAALGAEASAAGPRPLFLGQSFRAPMGALHPRAAARRGGPPFHRAASVLARLGEGIDLRPA